MAFDPISAGIGVGLNVAGGILSRKDQVKAAERDAAARNASLGKNNAILADFGAQNRGVFDTNMTNYTPENQAAQLAGAQTARGDANAAAIAPSDPNASPIQADASPATRSDLAKRMLSVHTGAVNRAKSLGKLGGYSDAWMANELNNKQASRDIGVTNDYAAGRKALIAPESDLAAAAAYKPPSIWGPLLQGAGGVLSGAGGAGGFGGGSAASAAPDLFAAGGF